MMKRNLSSTAFSKLLHTGLMIKGEFHLLHVINGNNVCFISWEYNGLSCALYLMNGMSCDVCTCISWIKWIVERLIALGQVLKKEDFP